MQPMGVRPGVIVVLKSASFIFRRVLLRVLPVGWSALGAFLILKHGLQQAWRRWLGHFVYRLLSKGFNLRNSGEPMVGKLVTPLYDTCRRNFTLPAADASLLYTEHFEPRMRGASDHDARLCLPVILIRTPYSPILNEMFAYVLAERGYHVVTQDVRGRFNSEGELKFLLNEKEDAAILIDWACKQAWCKDGKVALMGVSMDGYSAYSALAAECDRLRLTADVDSVDGGSDGESDSNLTLPGFAQATQSQPCQNNSLRISAMATIMSSSDIGKRGMLHSGALCLETCTRYLDLMLFTHKPRKSLLSVRLKFFRDIYTCFARHKGSAWRSVEEHLPLGTIDKKVELFNGLTFGQSSPVWELHSSPDDPYWNGRDHSTSLVAFRSHMPAMSFTTGWYDVFVDAMVADYETAHAVAVECGSKPPWLIVGPWSHFDEQTKTIRDILQFFDCYLKGASENSGPVQLFMLGCGAEHVHANGNTARDPPNLGLREKMRPWDTDSSAFCDHHPAWRCFPAWPPPNAAFARLSLTMTDELSLLPVAVPPPSSGARDVTFTFDPANPPCPNGGARFGFDLAGRVCNKSMELREDVLVFTSPELSGGDLEIVGRPVLTLLLSANSPSCDIFVRLCDVDSRGRSILVCDGFARVGGIGGAQSTPVKGPPQVSRRPTQRRVSMLSITPEPVRRGSSASILSPKSDRSANTMDSIEPLALEVIMYPTAAMFRRGNRIRLCIAGGAFPMYSRNLGYGEMAESAEDMRTQNITLMEPSLAPPSLASIGASLQLPVLGGEDQLSLAFGQ